MSTEDKSNLSPSSSQSTSRWETIKENVQAVLIALVIAFLLRTFIAEPRYIPSDSMVPTLQQGDRLVVEKVSSHFRPPQRGDIVVFEPPPQLQMQGYSREQAFIKRIIGEPGQTIAVTNGLVYIDNQPLRENYIAEAPRYNLPPVKIPANYLFVMGDNRNNSNDSHVWGVLPEVDYQYKPDRWLLL